jgi:hypothetical protein
MFQWLARLAESVADAGVTRPGETAGRTEAQANEAEDLEGGESLERAGAGARVSAREAVVSRVQVVSAAWVRRTVQESFVGGRHPRVRTSSSSERRVRASKREQGKRTPQT